MLEGDETAIEDDWELEEIAQGKAMPKNLTGPPTCPDAYLNGGV